MVGGRGGRRGGRGGGREGKAESSSHSSDVKADDIDERKNKHCLNVLVLGHTAAGKSLALRKIDKLQKDRVALEKTTEKFEEITMDESRQSRLLEHAMEKNEDGLEQGKRVTFGEVKYETKTSIIHFLEAPSDYRYVPNIMSKAMQADIAVLFVSASEDKDEIKDEEKEKQSNECAYLISTLAITKILVVVSKMDNETWKRESYKMLESDITKLLKNLGFKAPDFKFLPLSARSGQNFQTKMKKDTCTWWEGPCFLEALDAFEVPARINKTLNHKWDTYIDDLVIVDLRIDKNPSDAASWHSRSKTLLALKYYAASFEATEKAAQHGFCPLDEKKSVASLMTKGHYCRIKKDFNKAIDLFNVAKDFYFAEENNMALECIQGCLDRTWTEWEERKAKRKSCVTSHK